MTGRDWKDVIDVDFPDVGSITAKRQELAFKQSRRMRGSVRLTMGRIPTTESYEERRQRVLRTKRS